MLKFTEEGDKERVRDLQVAKEIFLDGKIVKVYVPEGNKSSTLGDTVSKDVEKPTLPDVGTMKNF